MGVFNLFWFAGYGIGGLIGGVPTASNASGQTITVALTGGSIFAFTPVFAHFTRQLQKESGAATSHVLLVV